LLLIARLLRLGKRAACGVSLDSQTPDCSVFDRET
jgi:hypothetical protein